MLERGLRTKAEQCEAMRSLSIKVFPTLQPAPALGFKAARWKKTPPKVEENAVQGVPFCPISAKKVEENAVVV